MITRIGDRHFWPLPSFQKLVRAFSAVRLCRQFSSSNRYYQAMGSASADSSNHYDVIVVGGGSGGLACSKEAAASFGKKVALLDFVDPTPHGVSWGLGGTCVNVGCIPKKLMHHASLLGHSIEDAVKYGWELPNEGKTTHDWIKLKNAVQDNIKSSNWVYRVQLRQKTVQYINAYGSFVDNHTIKAIKKNGEEQILTADAFVLAMGLRPKYDKIPGAELGISSDDLFSLPRLPGKTFVIGGSYVALECAGFLGGLGFPVTLAIRSIPLRGFDQQMAHLVTDAIVDLGVKINWRTVPTQIVKLENGQLEVTWKDEHNQHHKDVFDTVIWAIGREPKFSKLGFEKIGLKLEPKSGKVLVDDLERTNIPNIYAIGDICFEKPELTPVAIQAGKFLARRLYGGSQLKMDYNNVATAVFTPAEYSCVGMSEEVAIEKVGADNIEVYHAFYKPTEFTVSKRDNKQCYLKVICRRTHPQTVLGMHFVGPHAGEVMQGFAAALRCGLTYEQLEQTVGIHPTSAEEFVNVNITKRSGGDPNVASCCG